MKKYEMPKAEIDVVSFDDVILLSTVDKDKDFNGGYNEEL